MKREAGQPEKEWFKVLVAQSCPTLSDPMDYRSITVSVLYLSNIQGNMNKNLELQRMVD